MGTLEELIGENARADSGYAIYALLQVAKAQYDCAGAIQRLGNGSASTHFGAIECFSMQANKVAEAIVEASAR